MQKLLAPGAETLAILHGWMRTSTTGPVVSKIACDIATHCEADEPRKRCPKADRAAQHFRILQEVNNLNVLDDGGERRLTDDERKIVVNALTTTTQQSFGDLRKKLGFHEDMTFNIERGGRDKLKGHETDAAMSSNKGVGKRWKTLDDEVKDRVVDICVHETREDVALRQLTEDCGLTPEEAERAANTHLPEGHANFCRGAIERLNHHLERGLLLMADDATNSALHAAGYLRPDQRVVNAGIPAGSARLAEPDRAPSVVRSA